jgi:formylglycine-generating enzyme required for sulfatase activity
MWQQQGSETTLPSQAAELYVEDLNQDRHGGFSDWRVPTLEELASLISPAGINNGLFIDRAFDPVQTEVWASDQVPPAKLFAGKWYVSFAVGGIAAKRLETDLDRSDPVIHGVLPSFVRAVRSGMEPPMRSAIETKRMLPGKAEPPQASLSVEITGKDGATMRLVQAGPFQMGVDDENMKEAGPAHTVYLKAFYLDQYEVTVEQYAKFLEASGTVKPEDWIFIREQLDPKVPMVSVGWHFANGYCDEVGKRLPTEAEWEKAARGTDGRRYPWGDVTPSDIAANVLNDHLNVTLGQDRLLTSDYKNYGLAAKKGLRIRGSFPIDKSPYGIFDLGGNVAEWVGDFFDLEYYKRSPDRNPVRRHAPPKMLEKQVVRGGSWVDSTSIEKKDAKSLYETSQTFFRRAHPYESSGMGIGFRCAQNAK